MCNISCDKFLDEDLSDDIDCFKLIMYLQGWTAWKALDENCMGDMNGFIDECL